MDAKEWAKELRHRVNEQNGDYYDCVELSFEEVNEVIEILENAEFYCDQ